MYMPIPLPRRLIATSLILIFIGLLPQVFSFIGLSLPSPMPLLKLLLPPNIAQWLIDHVTFNSIAIIGLALLPIAVVLVVRKLWEQRYSSKPISTSNALLEEAKAIHGKEADQTLLESIDRFNANPGQISGHDELSNVSPSLYRWLNGIDPASRTALCFSGGGIRSASFALGVLQALATHPRTRTADGEGAMGSPEKSLLAQFKYLSTVSGGGYIGGWFSAWVQRVGYAKVWQDFVRVAAREQDPGEQAAPIKWLRVHSNFLTPKLGLSGDTLAGVAIFLRNLLLNWLVLLPVLCAVLILMKLLALEVFNQWMTPEGWSLRNAVAALLIWLVLMVAALSFLLRNRPSRTHDEETQANETALLTRVLLPSIVAAISFVLFLALNIVLLDHFLAQGPGKDHVLLSVWPVIKPLLESLKATLQAPSASVFIAAGFFGAFVYALSYAISWIWSWPKASVRAWNGLRARFTGDGRVEKGQAAASNFWRWTLAGAIYGVLVMTITYWFLNSSQSIERLIFLDYFRQHHAEVNAPRHLLALLYLGVPAMLVAQLLAEMIFVGLTSEEPNSEEDREWLGRAAGLSLLAGLGWIVVMHLAFISSDIAIRLGKVLYNYPGASLAVLVLTYAIAALAAAIGRSGRTPAVRGAEMDAKARTANATLSMVAVVLLVVLIVGVSALIDYLILEKSIADHTGASVAAARGNLLLALVAVLFVGLIASASININRFSMHALYRNRLIRTFLGASNQKRRADPFTNFARDDNPPMHTLWPSQHDWKGEVSGEVSGERSWRPFHIVNIALNVSSSQEHLEWQERKACSFTVSALHSGSAITGFRSSKEYGDGISLGTAIAVSGAAASPNMGYMSSAPLAFLMALFNVRLGWWLGNPGKSGEATHKYDGPRNALVPFLSEMLGMTSDTSRYVYLSDGGHFENLALYEMVRRRCCFILVSDAGCDPEFAFEDIGNAVRKVEIDLGVPIRFHGLDKLRARDAPNLLDELLGERSARPVNKGESPPYHAIGIIDYPAADGPGVERGIILYVKPSYHGTESSAGVRSYAISNPAFPHESTSDQFFTESQMESYRALGFEIMDGLVRKAQALKGKTDLPLQELLSALAQHNDGRGPAAPAPQPGSEARLEPASR